MELVPARHHLLSEQLSGWLTGPIRITSAVGSMHKQEFNQQEEQEQHTYDGSLAHSLGAQAGCRSLVARSLCSLESKDALAVALGKRFDLPESDLVILGLNATAPPRVPATEHLHQQRRLVSRKELKEVASGYVQVDERSAVALEPCSPASGTLRQQETLLQHRERMVQHVDHVRRRQRQSYAEHHIDHDATLF